MTKRKASSGPQWQFVLTTGDGTTETRRSREIVRKNAMKAFRRNERLARMKEYANSIAEDKGLQKYRHYFEDGRIGLDTPDQGRPYSDIDLLGIHDRERDTLAKSSLDSSLPTLLLPASSSAQRLLHHFVNHIALQLQPLGALQTRNPIASFFVPQALQSPGILAGLLFHSGVHLDTLQKRSSWTPVTLYYQGETIRIIQQDLMCEKACVRVLAMVAFLGAAGNITGDVTLDRSHMYALQRLVHMQGGLCSIGHAQGSLALLLATLVIFPLRRIPLTVVRGDLINSTISGNPPVLDQLDISRNVHLSFLPADTASTVMASPRESDAGKTLTSLEKIISRLTHLHSHLVEDTETTVTSILMFGHLCCAVEHRLLCLGWSSAPCSTHDVLSQATRHALVLCMSKIFRTFRTCSPIIIASQGRLLASLAALDISSLDDGGETHRRLLWLLCVGGVSCVPKRQQWYAEKIVQVLRVLQGPRQMATIEWVRTGLAGFVWDAKLDGASFAAFWEKVCMLLRDC